MELLSRFDNEIERLEELCHDSRTVLRQGVTSVFSFYLESTEPVELPTAEELITPVYMTDSSIYEADEYGLVWCAAAIGFTEFAAKHPQLNNTNSAFAYLGLERAYENPNVFCVDLDDARKLRSEGTDWLNFLLDYCNKEGYLHCLRGSRETVKDKVVSYQELKEMREVLENGIQGTF